MIDWDAYILGETEQEIAIDSSQDNETAILQLLNQSQNTLDIFTRDLEPRLLNTPVFSEACRRLATLHDRSKIRILVIDPDYVIKHGHRLLDLSRRLTSSIEIRKAHEDYARKPESFYIADGRGWLHRKLASRYEAMVNFYDPLAAKGMLKEYNQIWEHSKQYIDFKRLYI